MYIPNFTPIEQFPNVNNQVSNQVPQYTFYPPQDSVSISKPNMSESISITRGYDERAVQLEGDLNGKQASFKYYYDFYKSPEDKNEYYEFDTDGTIDNKNIVLHQKRNHISGVYDNKQIELDISLDYKNKKKILNYGANDGANFVKLSGTIDNKPYSIELPNAEVPKDEDTRDIITSILICNWLAPFTIDNKITHITPSKSNFERESQRLENKHQEFKEYKGMLFPMAISALTTAAIAGGKFIFNHLKNLKNVHP